jgi:hypothetical protein
MPGAEVWNNVWQVFASNDVHGINGKGEGMSDKTVAEYREPKMTGQGAMERYAAQEGRELKPLDDGEFRFVDGWKHYKPVMMKDGWKIVWVNV